MNISEISDQVFGDDPAKRAKWFKLFEDPVWKPVYNQSFRETREAPFKKLQKVAQSKICSVKDFITDPTNIFTAHEMIAQIDGSAVIKFTVQFNLFGGSMVALHTDRHKKYFDMIDNFDIVGCFCLTELGYGNNAVKMETTVTYDKSSDEFVVNTPSTLGQKYWITNGVCHSNYSLVFGQTIIDGKNEGVNAFLVRVRDDQMKEMPGVQIVDMGVKMGLNGVDNGALKYSNVRIPRENMMNKYADVDASGKFSSDIKGVPQRFFKVTERLLSGRICIASMAIGAARSCLYIAIKYAQQRRGVGPTGKSDTPIFNYQLQQNALIPLLSRTFAIGMGHNQAKRIFQNPVGHEDDLLAICCIDKTMLGWNLEEVAKVCRERCGGQGYLAVNKFGEYIALAHAALTAEGDNRVLMTKIVKDMITNITKKGHKLPSMSQSKQQISQQQDITSLQTLLDLHKFREATLYKQLMGEMARLTKQGKSQFQILMREVSDNIQNLALAYGERQSLEASLEALSQLKNAENIRVMTLIYQNYALENVLRDSAFYQIEGILTGQAVQKAIATNHSNIKEIAKHIDQLLETLNVAKHALWAPIAADYETYNAYPNYGEVVGARL